MIQYQQLLSSFDKACNEPNRAGRLHLILGVLLVYFYSCVGWFQPLICICFNIAFIFQTAGTFKVKMMVYGDCQNDCFDDDADGEDFKVAQLK